jgi:hypothetical protein
MGDTTSAAPRPDLEVELQRIKEEIAGYPAPIAGCDAQFNHLLAERQRLLEALRDMDKGA